MNRRELITLIGGAAAAWPLAARAQQLKSEDNEAQKFVRAIADGNETLVRQYLLAGMSANSTVAFGMMPVLYLAEVQNHPRVMTLLIQHGARLNDKFGPSQRTALHDAALFGRIECMRVLLSAGADPNPVNKFGRTPLNLASNAPLPLRSPANVLEVVALLREYGGK